MIRSVLIVLAFLVSLLGELQGQASIFGVIKDIDTFDPIEFVSVSVKGSTNGVETDALGEYRIEVPVNEDVTLVFQRLGYQETEYELGVLYEGAKRNVNLKLVPDVSDLEITIRESRIEDVGMVREEVTEFKKLPTASGNFESILPHIALGASGGTGGELSSQYNVRGGNYDENLVYVNDFEIFRPQLIRSNQQEGLSFPNIDLIRDVSFSSGGFEARYGDKMSSVLDIKYKRPEEFAGSVSASFLGASAHIEGSKKLGANAYNKFRYLLGARYKTTRYLLGSLDVTGEYTPDFADVQTYLTYDISKDFQIGLLGNYNTSTFNFIPEERVSASGLFTNILQLTTAFEGQEKDGFQNAMGGLSLTYLPERDKNPLFLKLLASYYDNYETENFDILGYYRLSQIEFDLEGAGSTEEVAVLGTGIQHIYARNRLKNNIANVQFRGGLELQGEDGNRNNFLQWGLKFQKEDIDDRLSEWERLDSAGYSIPYSESEVLLNETIKSENTINSSRVEAFFQNSFSLVNSEKSEIKITGGIRANYWTYNEEVNISPRFQLFYRPLDSPKDITYKLSGGVYYQPAFYRELRTPAGSVSNNVSSQRSIHVVAGMSYDFNWERISRKKFRLITELYYKKLDDLVSYNVDNVRIRYSGENDASGYVAGLDLRINGEFVPDAESWINISFLQAKESLTDIQHTKFVQGENGPLSQDVTYVPRPTDQFFNLNLFFQDYLPNNRNFKMQLNLTYGSGLPFGLKGRNQIVRNNFRFKPYQRVDIGFSYLIWDKLRKKRNPNSFLRNLDNAWVSLEVFNLMDISNVGSNIWVKTIGLQQYAIPNFLTSRRLNLKLKVDF